ncbi:zf-TFIIB domain-containing protein [Pedobacter suwonensis]|uniref:TFIIB-type zinc ribbon-containing protein n=1 Tax=Pedobacter suwonensis TaxID=332999 RepID=UPI0036B935C9
MKCPHCNETLVMSERQGVEIDYCPNCRGVWLDKGELDKIIERTSDYSGPNQRSQQIPQPHAEEINQHGHHSERHGGHHGSGKRRGFFGDLFHF